MNTPAYARGKLPASLLLDRQGVILSGNRRAQSLFVAAAGNLAGRPLTDFLPDFPLSPQTPAFNLASAGFWAEGGALRFTLGECAQAAGVPVELHLRQRWHRGQSLIIVNLSLVEAGRQLSEDMANFRARAAASSEVVMVTDLSGRIEYVNPAFEQLTGFCAAEAVGQPSSLIRSGLHAADFYSGLWQTLLAGREFHALFANRRRDGEIFHEEKTIRPFVDGQGRPTHYIAVSRPVSDFLQSALARLERLANHDALTGLPNRGIFLDRLEQHCARAARRGTPFALAFVDLDGFKEINDSLGHDAGDLALCALARQLQVHVRGEDTVARLGGDEFGILLGGTVTRSSVEELMNKLLAALAAGFRCEGRSIPLHASIGVCLHDADVGGGGEAMLRRADRAMYRCKASGGNGVCFDGEDALSASVDAGAADTEAASLRREGRDKGSRGGEVAICHPLPRPPA